MNAQELKNIYWSFYDQLLTEHAEKAKANYDENYDHSVVPDSHHQAIESGFMWELSPKGEGEGYWREIFEKLEGKTYNLQLIPQKITVEVKEFTAPELTERMATKEDHIKLEEVVKSIKAETINEAPPTEPNFGSEDILEEALRITGGDRMSDYGPPDQDFRRTAIMWEQLLNGRIVDGKLQIKPQDVAACMIALKLSRQAHQGKRDNWVDVAGYARCGALCEELES